MKPNVNLRFVFIMTFIISSGTLIATIIQMMLMLNGLSLPLQIIITLVLIAVIVIGSLFILDMAGYLE